MNVKFINLKMVPFKLDHNRKVSIHVEGDVVTLSPRLAKIARLYPNYLKEVVEELDEVKTEEKPEVESIMDNDDVLEVEEVVKTEELEEIDFGVEKEKTLFELFANDLAAGEVEETKTLYKWEGLRIVKKSFEDAEDKNEFLNELKNR